MSSENDILKLQKQFLPTGRAFKVPRNGNFEKLLSAKAIEYSNAINDNADLLNKIIPDNEEFTENDAAKWESVLGIYGSGEDSLTNRKSAILRKMRFPSGAKGRQHKKYLEGQLRAANFDVRVYEYNDVKGYFSNQEHSLNTQHSYQTTHGGGLVIPFYHSIVANFLNAEDETDVQPTINNLPTVFWIAGETFNEFANIPPFRLTEFRNVILTIKPNHTVAFLRIINEDDWILATGKWNMNGYWYNSATWKL